MQGEFVGGDRQRVTGGSDVAIGTNTRDAGGDGGRTGCAEVGIGNDTAAAAGVVDVTGQLNRGTGVNVDIAFRYTVELEEDRVICLHEGMGIHIHSRRNAHEGIRVGQTAAVVGAVTDIPAKARGGLAAIIIGLLQVLRSDAAGACFRLERTAGEVARLGIPVGGVYPVADRGRVLRQVAVCRPRIGSADCCPFAYVVQLPGERVVAHARGGAGPAEVAPEYRRLGVKVRYRPGIGLILADLTARVVDIPL